jgi:DNA-binding MarR family transcriptional regulator
LQDVQDDCASEVSLELIPSVGAIPVGLSADQDKAHGILYRRRNGSRAFGAGLVSLSRSTYLFKMKSFQDEDSLPIARELVEVCALAVRLVRAEVRRRPTAQLTYAQIRALGAVAGAGGISVNEAAEYLGVGAPTTSKVMSELVDRGLVERGGAPDDRRRVVLRETDRGRRILKEAVEPANVVLAELLDSLREEERVLVLRAVQLLRPLLQPGGRSMQEDVVD